MTSWGFPGPSESTAKAQCISPFGAKPLPVCPGKPSHITSHIPKQLRIMTCSSIHSPWNIIIHFADAWEVPSSVTEEITESLGVPSMAALPAAWFLLCAPSHQCKGICMSPSHFEGLLVYVKAIPCSLPLAYSFSSVSVWGTATKWSPCVSQFCEAAGFPFPHEVVPALLSV